MNYSNRFLMQVCPDPCLQGIALPKVTYSFLDSRRSLSLMPLFSGTSSRFQSMHTNVQLLTMVSV